MTWVHIATLLARGLPVLATVVGACILAYHGKPGWGWLLFVAVLLNGYDFTLD